MVPQLALVFFLAALYLSVAARSFTFTCFGAYSLLNIEEQCFTCAKLQIRVPPPSSFHLNQRKQGSPQAEHPDLPMG